MSQNDLMQLPDVKEIQEFLNSAKHDMDSVIQDDPELASSTKLISEVINVLQDQVQGKKDLNKLSLREKISFGAHLNFLQSLLEDFFFEDEFEDFDDDSEYEDDEEK